jgi:predicted DNA-binding transcriptional regulator AlpA
MSVQLPANADPARRPLIPAHERMGLSRAEAAEYIGVSTSLFEEMVADGRMPPAKQINSRKVWMRTKIEKAFADLPDAGQDKDSSSPWRDCA